MTLGQEFSTYAVMLDEDEDQLKEAALLIREINLGATAIGTGIQRASRLCGTGVAAAYRNANAIEVAQLALATGKSVYNLVLEKKLLSKERLDAILQPDVLTRPRPLLAARE